MIRVALITAWMLTACDPPGTCEHRDDLRTATCAEMTKSACAAEKGDFISNAHCSTLGYRCKDNRGVWSKRCD